VCTLEHGCCIVGRCERNEDCFPAEYRFLAVACLAAARTGVAAAPRNDSSSETFVAVAPTNDEGWGTGPAMTAAQKPVIASEAKQSREWSREIASSLRLLAMTAVQKPSSLRLQPVTNAGEQAWQ